MTTEIPRAERRRQMREAGQKRAKGKRGRRSEIRASAETVKPEPAFPSLAAAGFVVPRNKLIDPREGNR